MNKTKIIVIIFALAILSWGCECVVESDPDAIIAPTEFANVLFVNAMPADEMNELHVYSSSKYIKYLDTIYNTWTSLNKDYKKVGIMVAGVKNTVKIVNSPPDTNEIFFNGVLDLKKDSNYTMVAYGDGKNIQTIIKYDYIKNYNSDNIYLRCYNATTDSPELIVSFKTEGFDKTLMLKSGEASEISTFPNGNYTVNIKSKDSLYSNTYFDIKFLQGKMNNFIVKGSYQLVNMNYGIVTAEIPGK